MNPNPVKHPFLAFGAAWLARLFPLFGKAPATRDERRRRDIDLLAGKIRSGRNGLPGWLAQAGRRDDLGQLSLRAPAPGRVDPRDELAFRGLLSLREPRSRSGRSRGDIVAIDRE